MKERAEWRKVDSQLQEHLWAVNGGGEEVWWSCWYSVSSIMSSFSLMAMLVSTEYYYLNGTRRDNGVCSQSTSQYTQLSTRIVRNLNRITRLLFSMQKYILRVKRLVPEIFFPIRFIFTWRKSWIIVFIYFSISTNVHFNFKWPEVKFKLN